MVARLAIYETTGFLINTAMSMLNPSAIHRFTQDISRLKQLQARRKLWLKVHLWLGLTAGAALVIIGLTGSILVLWQEIDTWLNDELMSVPIPGPKAVYRPLDEIVAAAKSTIPQGAKLAYTSYPRNPDDVFVFSYQEPGVAGEKADSVNVFVDPYTARITGSRIFYDGKTYLDNCLIGIVFKLHYALLWKEGGVILVGILGVLLVISVLTGLIVWWPLTGQWRKALTFKPKGSFERFNFDLHKTSGFYSALVLLAVLISGIYMNLPDQFIWLVERFSTVVRPENIQSKDISSRVDIGLGKAVSIAQTNYPGGKLQYLNFPTETNGVYQICSDEVEELNRFVIDARCVFVDQHSGEILRVMDPSTGSAGDVFLQWQWPLHSGKAFGVTGRILVFLSGLACPILFVTGVMRWLQKRKAVRRNPNFNIRPHLG